MLKSMVLFLLLWSSLTVDTVQEGPAAYQKGDFNKAVMLWQQAADVGNNLGLVN